MKIRIATLLLAALFAGSGLGPVTVRAQSATEQAQASAGNRIENLEVAQQGGSVYVKLTLQQPLSAVPASFSVANPARIAFDFPGTANALGRSTQPINAGDLVSANIVQAGDRTRLVLNLARMAPYETRLDGNALSSRSVRSRKKPSSRPRQSSRSPISPPHRLLQPRRARVFAM